MRQAIRQHLSTTHAIPISLVALLASQLYLISPTFAQLTTPSSQETGRVESSAQLLGKNSPVRPLSKSNEKKDAQTSTRKPHRLIRKPHSTPSAPVEPSLPDSLLPKSLPIFSSLHQAENITPSKEPSLPTKYVQSPAPLATMSITNSPATATQSSIANTASTATPLKAVAAGSTPALRSNEAAGRTMGRLGAEMPGLAQLISPPPTSIPSVNPAIGASPTSFSFTATQGSGNPANQTLSISNTGGGTLAWSASDNVSWLTATPASGTGNGSVTLSIATGSLTAGTYSGMITLSATGATGVTVPVTFTVTAAPVPPAIGASPTSFSFTATQGSGNPANQTLSISNTGGGTLAWSASDNVSWLTATPASGTGNGSVTLSIATGSLTAGTYSGMITLSATGATGVTVPVTFTVTAAPSLTISPSSQTFTATQGSSNPATQSFTISSNGTWTASDNASWLSITPNSGSGNGTVTVSVNTSTATLGSNNATITITGSGLTRTIAVTLTLDAPATSSATLQWSANAETDLAGYKVYRATSSGGYVSGPIATLPANVTSYQATGLQLGTTYYFVITAYDSAGNESQHSNEVSKSAF